MSMIDFAVWSPSEEVFWQDWIKAGICTAPRVFAPGYTEMMISDQTKDGWAPSKATGDVDEDGYPIRVPVPGWHANVRVYGGLAKQFIQDLPQSDKDGNILPLFERTIAAVFFNLEKKDKDSATGFPAGYRNESGVTYADPRDFNSPTNVWA